MCDFPAVDSIKTDKRAVITQQIDTKFVMNSPEPMHHKHNQERLKLMSQNVRANKMKQGIKINRNTANGK